MHISVRNNSTVLVSTDRKYMAVELIGHDAGEWEATINIPLPLSINYDADLEINPLAGMNMMFVGSSNIWAVSPPEYAMWRAIPERASQVKEAYGFLFFDTNNLTKLAACSPSGHIIFPKLIDTRQPVLLNDENEPNWMGFFMGVNEQYSNNLKPAIMQGWAL